MSASPDYTLAYHLSPHLKPKTHPDYLTRDKQVLAERLARAEGKTVEQVLQEVDESLSGTPQPITQQKPSGDLTPATTTRAEAKFFANKEGTKYYPIEKLDTPQFARMKPEKAVFFKSKDEAEAASFISA